MFLFFNHGVTMMVADVICVIVMVDTVFKRGYLLSLFDVCKNSEVVSVVHKTFYIYRRTT